MKEKCCVRASSHEETVRRIKETAIGEVEIERMASVFQTLSDSGRLKIVLALLQGDLCVSNLMEVCGATQSAVSHQLRVLRDNKIVKAKRIGQSVEYSIADEHIREIVEMSVAHLHCELES